MEKLADLPAPALITFGATLALIFAFRYLGIISADKAGPSSATVASVIVDPTALMSATAAVKHLAEVMTDGQEEAKNNAHMLCRRIEGLANEVEDLTSAIRDIRVDLARLAK
ncbi:hypothetical protein [Rhizobium grahamii]|uniref:Transmembrane protein n=1 Tax=Rhizobium grahamii CCGE 502 TaxID=990285 RepID=S3HNG8_9HYPH|nr:hypothetical protein [Rhizobium grahamii]EPE99550.1 hypothetical protein RGCCGE502_05185 [Rhizobium grahamii CCGE 502]